MNDLVGSIYFLHVMFYYPIGLCEMIGSIYFLHVMFYYPFFLLLDNATLFFSLKK
jgi:hypothetical protein